MRKFSKKQGLWFIGVLALAVLVVGLFVQAEDGPTTNDLENFGSSQSSDSCFTSDEDRNAYVNASKITYQEPTSENGWVAKLSSLPANAKVTIYLNDTVTNYENTSSSDIWDLSVAVKDIVFDSMIDLEIKVYPNYIDLTGECAKAGRSYYTMTDTDERGSYTTTLDEASIQKQQELENKWNFIPSAGSSFSADANADPNQTQNLSCDYNPEIATNKKQVVGTKTEKINSYCSRECKETVSVTYGPPVVTQAGMGVEYEVTVTSKLECQAVKTASYPQISAPKVCVPRPVCNGGHWEDKNTEAAGPSAQFDACVLSCDGGNYSQECIASCYQQTYQEDDMASTAVPSSFSTVVPVYKQYDYRDGVTRTGDPLGYYTGSGNNLKWNSSQSGCGTSDVPYGECAGYYYYSTPARTAWSNARLHQKVTNDVSRRHKYYFFDTNGILRSYTYDYSVGADVYCNANCQWVGCSGTPGKDYYLTEQQANEKYQQDLANAEAIIRECSEEPTVKEDTAVYTVSVENTPDNNLTFSTSLASKDYKAGMEEDVDGTKIYRFPEARIDDVTGEVEYGKTDNKTEYKAGGNRFYTSLLSEDTNTPWYNLKTGQIDLPEFNELTECKEGQDRTCSEIDYNIDAKIKNYGYLDWDFDIACFYALENDEDDCVPGTEGCDEDPENPGPNDDDQQDPKYLQFIFRPISLNDVFPASYEAPLGRAPRWNWSAGAINTTNRNYQIDPTALTEKIEKDNYEIYNDDQELDYEFYIDRQTINYIRSYNQERGDYLNYDTTNCRTKNGMTICQSALLDTLRTRTSFGGNAVLQRRGVTGCNNQRGESCDTYSK